MRDPGTEEPHSTSVRASSSGSDSQDECVATPAGERRARRSVAVVVIALAAALLLCCAGTIGAIIVARGATESALETYRSGSEWVGWSGNGRFAVIQSQGSGGEPLVAVWDSSTGEVRVQHGYSVVALEPYGARVWVIAVEGDAPVHDPLLSSRAADPDELLVWSLGDGSADPAAPSASAWEPWPGPADRVLAATSAVEDGTFPALAIEDPARGSAVDVEMPEGAGQLELLGWSPSGEYVAVIGRSRADLPVYVIIIDATRGARAASVHTSIVARPGSPGVAWLPREDALMLSVPDDESPTGAKAPGGRLMLLYPDGTLVAAEDGSIPSPDTGWDGTGPAVLGTGADGVVVVSGETAWLLGEDGSWQASRFSSAYSTAYHPTGGLLLLDEEWSDRDATIRTVVSHAPALDGALTTIWEGPERTVRFGLKGE